MLELITHKLKSPEWTENFEALNLLRSLNKSYPSDVYNLFQVFGQYIMANLASPKSSLLKNTLALVHEVLSLRTPLHPQILLKTIPPVLKLATHTSKSTRMCAQGCIKLIITLHPQSASIFAIAQEAAVNPNPKIHLYAFRSLMKAIYFLKSRVGSLELSALEASFQAISRHLSDSKRNQHSKAKKLCQFFFSLMGHQNFQKFVQGLMDSRMLSLVSADLLMRAALNIEKPKKKVNFGKFMEKNRESVRSVQRDVRVNGRKNQFYFSKNEIVNF